MGWGDKEEGSGREGAIRVGKTQSKQGSEVHVILRAHLCTRSGLVALYVCMPILHTCLLSPAL